MPHLTLEYSANLEGRLDIQKLCSIALAAAASTGVLEMPATRVRAIRCDHFAIADEHADNAFVDATLRMGRGRSEEQKAETGKVIYAAMREYCAPLYGSSYFALSLELREIDSALSWKENGIKRRFA